jgi:hypothetical protein
MRLGLGSLGGLDGVFYGWPGPVGLAGWAGIFSFSKDILIQLKI